MRLSPLLLLLSFAAALRVAVVGDAGETTPAQKAAFDEIHALQPDLVLALGDNFYEWGLDHVDPSEEERVWGALAPLRILGVLGNHDHRGDPAAQSFLVPAPFYERELAPGVQLLALDTTTLFFGNHPEPQWRWLEAALSKAPAPKWRVVIGHHPLHSATKHCDEKRGPKDRLDRMLEDARVDIYLAGHTHCYERCHGNSTQHIIVGSTARLNSIRRVCPWEHSCTARHDQGWLLLNVTPTGLHSEFHRVNV